MHVENQKRELQEKHKLLCEAVKAMEIEEEEFKKVIDAKDREMQELKRQNDLLEHKSQVRNAIYV